MADVKPIKLDAATGEYTQFGATDTVPADNLAAHTHTLADVTDSGALAALSTVGTAELVNDAVTFAKMQNIATDRLIGRDTASIGDAEELTVSGGLEFTGSGGIQTAAFTGNVTKAAGGTALTIPALEVTNGMLAGGITVAKFANTTDGVLITWDSGGAPTTFGPGLAGQGVESNGTGAEPTFVNKREVPAINAQVGTTYTFVLSDARDFVTLSNIGGITATIPLNSTTAFPIGTVLDFAAINTGQVTLVAGAGVTINSADSKLKLRVQYSGGSAIKTATDIWILVGDIDT